MQHDTNRDGLLAAHQVKPSVALLCRMYGYFEFRALPARNRADEAKIVVPGDAVLDFEEFFAFYHAFLLDLTGERARARAAAVAGAVAAAANRSGSGSDGGYVSSYADGVAEGRPRSGSASSVEQVWGRLADASMPLANLSGGANGSASGSPLSGAGVAPRPPPRPSAVVYEEAPSGSGSGNGYDNSQLPGLRGMPYYGAQMRPAPPSVHVSRHGSVDVRPAQ